MKYSIKKYTRRRCYNKNKKKQYSNKGRSIKKRYSRRRITLYKKTKMRNQRKTKKMYQYGGAWKDADGNWHPGDPPTAAAAPEVAEVRMDAAAEVRMDLDPDADADATAAAAADATADATADAAAAAAADAAAAEDGISDDQVPSFTGTVRTVGTVGTVGTTYYIEVPLSPGGEDVRQSEDDIAVSKQELLKIFRDFPGILDSLGIQANDADNTAGSLVRDIQTKACSECSPSGSSGGACVFDRPNQNQLYGKLLEMIFAILKVLLRGEALSAFFRLGPCEPFDIPHTLTRDTDIPQRFRNCAISIKTLLDKREKLVSRTTPSTGRIACGDAAIFLDSLRQSSRKKFVLKMVVIDYYLEKNEETGRTSSVVPRIMAVYNLTTNMELIFGRLAMDDVISHVSALKDRIASAQDPTHTEAQREQVLSGIRKSVIDYNVYMANNDAKFCLAYKESDKCKDVTPGKKKQQLRLQISIVAGNVTIPLKDFNSVWIPFDYQGPQTITGIQPESRELDPFPPQIMGTPTNARKKVSLRSWRDQYHDASGHPLGASARLPKKTTGAIARSKPSKSKSEQKLQEELLKELQKPQ